MVHRQDDVYHFKKGLNIALQYDRQELDKDSIFLFVIRVSEQSLIQDDKGMLT